MRCIACGTENDPGRKFCAECGVRLAITCPSCGTANGAATKFCGECGTRLNEATAAASGAAGAGTGAASNPISAQPVAERRVCSVLFADLVGFTPLSESRDPEEVRELLSAYFDTAATVINRYGGTVEKFIGDAVMAVWGTPTATEDDPERAVRAALELLEAVAALGRDAGAPGLAARAGVVTGPVAVTLGATGQGMVAGDAVNTAARVQAAAAEGSVLVDEGTWRVAGAAVGFTPAGEHALKGKTAPVPLWRADRVLAGVGGSQRVDGLEAPFLGRDAELRLVKEAFHACAERRTPRLVAVSGPAGVGKSRLGWEFFKYIDGLADTVWWHRGRCLSYGDGVAFWALAEMVRARLGIAEQDSTAVAADKLAVGLDRELADPAERAYVAPRLASLLGTDPTGPTLGREELFAGWRLFFERLAATTPVVLLVEDLQYADGGLLDFLEHLLDWARDSPIFLLTLARPELAARPGGWPAGRRNTTTLSLDPLDDAAMSVLLDGLVPGMPDKAKSAISARAEGIPLYAVETVRMLVDRDVVQPIDGVYRLLGDLGELAVPVTLVSLLAARLDSLDPDARALVADAAVLGGTFPAEALVAVSARPEAEVRRLLAELVRREVLGVRADPLSPERGSYGFVQTMFRQVAYDILSRRDRKTRHLVVASHLEATFADGGEEVAEVIASHLLDALAAVPEDADVPALRERAVAMLTRAGERAERTGAPATAAAAYMRAAELLEPSGAAESELAAAALWERAGKAVGLAGDYSAAVEHYRKAAGAHRRHHHVREAARADTGTGLQLLRQGRHKEARTLLQGALAALETDPDADTVAALGALARLETFTGHHDEADRLSAAALNQAQALDLPDATLAHLLVTRGITHTSANRPAQAVAYFREAVRRTEAAAASEVAGIALLNLADTLLSTDPPAAAEAARAAVTHCRRVGHRLGLGVATGNLIQVLLLTGDWTSAAEVYGVSRGDDGLGDDPFLAYSAVFLHALRGDSDEVAAAQLVIERWADSEDPQDLAAAATALAMAAMFEGNYTEALLRAQRALAYADALGVTAESIRGAWTLAADAALGLGDQAEATRLVDWLDAHPLGHIPPVLRAERLRIRARLLAAAADPAAVSAFDAAITALRQLGSPYHLAVGLLDQAEYLTATRAAAAAQRLAVEAGAIAQGLGAAPLTRRVQGLAGSPEFTSMSSSVG